MCREAAANLGRELDSAKKYAPQMVEAGFTNVVERKFRWAQNHWPRDPAHKEMGMLLYPLLSLSDQERLVSNKHTYPPAPRHQPLSMPLGFRSMDPC